MTIRFDSRSMEHVSAMGCKAYIVKLDGEDEGLYRMYMWNSRGGICENTIKTLQQLEEYFNHWSTWAGRWYHERGERFLKLTRL